MPLRTSRGSGQGLCPGHLLFEGIWDEWLQYFPLLVGEVHALLPLLKGHLTEPLYPHSHIYEIASRHFGTKASDYKTDVERRETRRFIGRSVAQGKPFFAYVAAKAPHSPAKPAPRDKHAYDGLKAPRLPSFNEKNVSDNPPWIRKLPRLSTSKKAKIDNRAEKRAESLQALDDLVAGVVGKLRDEGVMGNTYVFFTSDNGWHEGEHRILEGKARPYEEDVRMPLLVRGPGVAAGHQAHRLILDTDFLPTFTDLACTPSSPCDTQK